MQYLCNIALFPTSQQTFKSSCCGTFSVLSSGDFYTAPGGAGRAAAERSGARMRVPAVRAPVRSPSSWCYATRPAEGGQESGNAMCVWVCACV